MLHRPSDSMPARRRPTLLRWLIALALLAPSLAGPARAQGTDGHALLLQEGRFRVEIAWQAPPPVGGGQAQPVAISERAGAFWFFRPSNLEAFVKILDGGAVNGRVWLFYGSLTSLAYQLTVTDLSSGAERIYHKPPGPLASGVDLQAFPSTGGDAAVADRPLLAWAGAALPPAAALPALDAAGDGAPGCQPSPTALCLAGDRFRVEATWRRDPGGPLRAAGVFALTADTGYLWFGRADNPELMVKVLDGTTSNGAFWVLYGAASNLEYQIVVTDTASGRQRGYFNPRFQLGGLIDRTSFAPSAHPPAAPAILEPAAGGAPAVPWEVHITTGAFADPDPEDLHHCTDFEILAADDGGTLFAPVWEAPCATGPRRLSVGLDDGRFVGPRADQWQLEGERAHRARARFRDDSGRLSAWSERAFVTGRLAAIHPLRLAAVAAEPVPRWRDGAGAPVILPTALVPPSLRLEIAGGGTLVRWQGLDGVDNLLTVTPPASPPAAHGAVRLVVDPGDRTTPLALPASTVELMAQNGRPRTLYLPPLQVAPGTESALWVTTSGSTYAAAGGQVQPVFSQLARHSERPWRTGDPGTRVELVAAGFQLPVNIAFVPGAGQPGDVSFYVSELYGTIKAVTVGGTVSDFATGLLNFDPDGNIPGSGEIGLAGLLVEPASGDLLASLVYQTNPGAPSPLFSGRVLRFQSDDGGHTAGAVSTVLDLAPAQLHHAHQISKLSFGPDGMLYVHVGDGFLPHLSQQLDAFQGKILRLDPDGSAPEDNPFYDPGDGIGAADYVYALGFRNPFGGAWRPADGALYEVENGPTVDRLAKVVAGANYGWDLDGDNVGTDDDMRTLALYNWQPSHAPVDIVFPPAGAGLPPEWAGRAAVSELGRTLDLGPSHRGKQITLFTFAADGTVLVGPVPVLVYDGSGFATVAALAAGPDGLYFSDFFADLDDPAQALSPTARIWRLRLDDGAGAP